jgi:hypothetical protein
MRDVLASPSLTRLSSRKPSLYRNINQFDRAKALEKRAITIDPHDADAFYAIGFMNWIQAYKNTVAILATEGLADLESATPICLAPV